MSSKTYNTPSGNWTIKFVPAFPLSLRISLATTINNTTDFTPDYRPDISSLLHEYCHKVNTNTLHYIESITIGRLWGSTYWRDQEVMADAYQNDPANATPQWIIDIDKDIGIRQAGKPIGHINHPV